MAESKTRLEKMGTLIGWPFFAFSYLSGKAFRAFTGGWIKAKAESLPQITEDNK